MKVLSRGAVHDRCGQTSKFLSTHVFALSSFPHDLARHPTLKTFCNTRSSYFQDRTTKEKYIPTLSSLFIYTTILLFRYPAAQSIALFSLEVGGLGSHTTSTRCIYLTLFAFLIQFFFFFHCSKYLFQAISDIKIHFKKTYIIYSSAFVLYEKRKYYIVHNLVEHKKKQYIGDLYLTNQFFNKCHGFSTKQHLLSEFPHIGAFSPPFPNSISPQPSSHLSYT